MLKDKLARALPALLATLLLTGSLITSARANVVVAPSTAYAGSRAPGAMMSCPDACAGWIAAGAAVVAAGAAVVQAAAATAAAAAAESVIIIVVLDKHAGHSLTSTQHAALAAQLDQ